jgi:uncharacterized membrane protein YwzB
MLRLIMCVVEYLKFPSIELDKYVMDGRERNNQLVYIVISSHARFIL